MSRQILIGCGLIAILLFGCSLRLGIDIINAGNEDINISLGQTSKNISPGLSFYGYYPAPKHLNENILIRTEKCRYEYIIPNLGEDPWKYLVGDSIKFRWFSDGRLVAYPPTPDVKIAGNPYRNSDDAIRTIPPVMTSCVKLR